MLQLQVALIVQVPVHPVSQPLSVSLVYLVTTILMMVHINALLPLQIVQLVIS